MVDILHKYINCFENLDEHNIDKLLACMSEKIIFIDPFNELVGKDKVELLLRYMFKKLKNPKFKVMYKIIKRKEKIIKWQFSCEFLKKKIEFFGLSELEVENGLIIRHEDFWDSGRNFYCNIPILGQLFKLIHK